MNNEWIFDNPKTMYLQEKVKKLDPNVDLNFDLSLIKWKPFIQNHAYGIKKYILQEETYLPSAGYQDARKVMYNPYTARFASAVQYNVFEKKIASFEDTKKIVFGTKWVKDEIDKAVKRELDKFDANKMKAGKELKPQKRSKSQSPPKRMGSSVREDIIRKQIEDNATKMLQRIYSSFSMKKLNQLMMVLNKFF